MSDIFVLLNLYISPAFVKYNTSGEFIKIKAVLHQ